MASYTIFRLIICIQIIITISVKFLLYQYTCHHIHFPDLSIDSPGYKTDQPTFSWRRILTDKSGMQVITPWEEYNTVSHRLGYKTKVSNESFSCINETENMTTEVFQMCQIYRQFVIYRLSNYEDAEVKFTDYIPGLVKYLDYKANLVSLGGKYIPRAFHIPYHIKEFLQYSRLSENQNKMWVQKNPWHRGNMVKEYYELNFTQESVIQEFIENPFLVDGRKFSIGIYVAFSSAKPLRAYVLNSTATLRFCPQEYDPHNFTDMKTHITDGLEFGAQLVREVDSLKDYSWKHQYSPLQSLDAHVDLVGYDPSAIHLQINDAIRDVLSTREDLITKITRKIDARSRHFMLTRWDFILDSDMKIHLIEVNSNPAMSCTTLPTDKLDPLFCNNVIYNLYRVMGIASFYDFHKTSIEYVIRDSDIHVKNAICYTTVCTLCEAKECQLCSKCLSDTQREILKSVLWEHLRRGETRLVYPFAKTEPMKPNYTSRSSRANTIDDDELTTEWLRFKCNTDIQWCSV
ncbi:probable tubulin polyglutamylase ttll-15 [Amphiura filiformis]|uniref:probable tubulin polyglutamylase ttll-15 n=1 Tax=Amphiura filiformis TaxID=82378 RepID=UPI003B222C8E